MKVEIYDQYKEIWLDNITNQLTEVATVVGQAVDTERYTLMFSGVGTTTVVAQNLNHEEACNLVTSLYVESTALGASYDDKRIRLNEGYAELLINFENGKKLNRVIYLKDE